MKRLNLFKIVRILAMLIPVLILCTLTLITLLLFTYSYQEFVHAFINGQGSTDLPEQFISNYFPPGKYEKLKWIMIFCSLLSLLFSFLLFYFRKQYELFIQQTFHSFSFYFTRIIRIYNSFNRHGKIVMAFILLFIFIRSCYYANSWFIQHDEAWNYNHFLSKNILYSIGAYNNYPLHNLISFFFVKLFGNAVFILRLPSILAGMSCIFILMLCIRYFSGNQWVAICSGIVFACFPVTLFYMLYARGVMFEIFFMMLVLILIYYFLSIGFTWKRVILLAVLNALGTFSMLSHPIFILSSSLALFLYAFSVSSLQKWVAPIYFLLSLMLSLLLLIPMMLGSGLSPGLSASLGIQLPGFQEILQQFRLYSSFITGYENGFIFILILCIISLLFMNKHHERIKFAIILNLILFIIVLIHPFIQRNFLPERSLGFLVLVPLSATIMIFAWISSYTGKPILVFALSTIFVVIFSYQSHYHNFLNWSRKLDQKAFLIFQTLQQENIHQVYNDCRNFDYFIPGIAYYASTQNTSIEINSSDPHSIHYKNNSANDLTGFVSCKNVKLADSLHAKKLFEANGSVLYKR